MSVRAATGGTCPAVKFVKHEEKQSYIKQKLNWWRETWSSLLLQNRYSAHLFFPQIFISAEPKRIDIMTAKLSSCHNRFPSVSPTYPNNVSLQCFFCHCNRCLTWYEVWRQNVCNVTTRGCLQPPWELVQVCLYGRAFCNWGYQYQGLQ